MVKAATLGLRAQFKAALALAETTAKQWALDHGVTESHLHLVLAGERESARLTEAVRDYVARNLKSPAKPSGALARRADAEPTQRAA